MTKRMIAVLVALAALCGPVWGEDEDVVVVHQEQTVVVKCPQPKNSGAVDAVLVVQNHASDEFRKPLSNIGDRVAAALGGEVFNLIDPNDAVGDGQNRGPWGENMPLSSATRLAENLGAQTLVTASVDEANVVGFGAPARAQAIRMTLTLAAKRLPKGTAAAAATVTATSRQTTPELLAQNEDAIYSELLGRLVEAAAAEFLPKCKRVAWHRTDGADAGKDVRVFFGCNVLGADVQVDGFSLGTCPGEFEVAPGIHHVLVSYPPYYQPFDRQVKFGTDGQTFAVVLQITPEGEQVRRSGILFDRQKELFDAELQRYRDAGEVEDYVRKAIADGTAMYWKNSYGRIVITDGSTQNIEFTTPVTDTATLQDAPTTEQIGKKLKELLAEPTAAQ